MTDRPLLARVADLLESEDDLGRLSAELTPARIDAWIAALESGAPEPSWSAGITTAQLDAVIAQLEQDLVSGGAP